MSKANTKSRGRVAGHIPEKSYEELGLHIDSMYFKNVSYEVSHKVKGSAIKITANINGDPTHIYGSLDDIITLCDEIKEICYTYRGVV